jgi:hypothetical protein
VDCAEVNLDPYGLAQYRKRISSQNGEDGITLALTTFAPTSNRFVEIGSGVGDENNTLVLLATGWHGIWIDPLLTKSHTKAIETVPIRATTNWILRTPMLMNRYNIGLLSIDVDGNDWHLWKAFGPGPAIVIIECNIERPLDVEYVMPYDPQHVSTPGHTNYGASLISMILLGREMGYTFVCMEHINAFFVRDDLVSKLGVANDAGSGG